jgi:hypothetical protein
LPKTSSSLLQEELPLPPKNLLDSWYVEVQLS